MNDPMIMRAEDQIERINSMNAEYIIKFINFVRSRIKNLLNILDKEIVNFLGSVYLFRIIITDIFFPFPGQSIYLILTKLLKSMMI